MAASVFLQYMLMEGSSLQTLLRDYLLEKDAAYYQRASASRLALLGIGLANLSVLAGAAAYLLPIYQEVHPVLHALLLGSGMSESKAVSLAVLLPLLLCACYFGGQVCLFGDEFKSFLYEDRTRLWQAVKQSSYKERGLLLFYSLIAFTFAALPAGGVAYYVFSQALGDMLGVPAQSAGIIVVSFLLALPAFLQSGLSKGLRLADATYSIVHWCSKDKARPRQGFSQALHALLNDIHEDNKEINNIESRLLTWASFYLGLLGIVLVSLPKLLLELADPKESVIEFVLTHVLGALLACLMRVGADCYLMYQGAIQVCNTTVSLKQKPAVEQSRLQLEQSLEHLSMKQYAGLFALFWFVGMGVQALGYKFLPVAKEHETYEYLSEALGVLMQGFVAMVLLAFHLNSLQEKPKGDVKEEQDLKNKVKRCFPQFFSRTRHLAQENQTIGSNSHANYSSIDSSAVTFQD